MAICNHCGAESVRVRSRWTEKGVQLADECPTCAPQSFEKFTAPSDKKIWMGYEAHPSEYVHAEDGGFDRKPEYRAEQEQKLTQPTEDEARIQRIAEEDKRATRRTEPMTSVEMEQALKKASDIAEWLELSAERQREEARLAEIDSWMAKYTGQA